MKAGARAVGVAESYGSGRASDGDGTGGPGGDRPESGTSTLAAVVTRADRVVDGFAFGSCSVGGFDATATVIGLLDGLDREDIRYVLISGIAPAWYNVLDLTTIHDAVGRPVLSVSFGPSPGLESALREAFDDEELEGRLSAYRRQPPRERLTVNGETVFVRAVGIPVEEARGVVRAFTPRGGRPEPIRVARLAARAADCWRADS